MDPLTQATLGAALPQSVAKSESMGLAFLCGLLAGMAPDLDVMIRSETDPLLFLEYHRQFTHSLIFIPFGAGLVTLFLWLAFGRRHGWPARTLYLFCFLGYATHALLDACTTYGTQLLWPFSDQRFAWNNISIIDPLLTVPLVLLVLTALLLKTRGPALVAMIWVVTYLGLGVGLRDVAIAAGYELAKQRGHAPVQLEAKPSFANIVLWKIVYREADTYYVDAVNILGEPVFYLGDSIQALNLERDLPWLDINSQQATDIERFRWFSNGYVAADPENPNRVIDLRYSLLPNEIRPLWSIELEPFAPPDAHVRYLTHRSGDSDLTKQFWTMLTRRTLPGT